MLFEDKWYKLDNNLVFADMRFIPGQVSGKFHINKNAGIIQNTGFILSRCFVPVDKLVYFDSLLYYNND